MTREREAAWSSWTGGWAVWSKGQRDLRAAVVTCFAQVDNRMAWIAHGLAVGAWSACSDKERHFRLL